MSEHYLTDGDQPATVNDVLAAKMQDAEAPGIEVEFSPEEAALMGAFEEDALTESEAKASAVYAEGW